MEQGLGATWLSNVLSLAAIGISLVVALIEQRRRRLILNKQEEDRQRERTNFIYASKATAIEARRLIVKRTRRIEDSDEHDINLSDQIRYLRRDIIPLANVFLDLRKAIPTDASLAWTISRIHRTLDNLCSRDWASASSGRRSYVLHTLKVHAEDLSTRLHDLSSLEPIGSTLALFNEPEVPIEPVFD